MHDIAVPLLYRRAYSPRHLSPPSPTLYKYQVVDQESHTKQRIGRATKKKNWKGYTDRFRSLQPRPDGVRVEAQPQAHPNRFDPTSRLNTFALTCSLSQAKQLSISYTSKGKKHRRKTKRPMTLKINKAPSHSVRDIAENELANALEKFKTPRVQQGKGTSSTSCSIHSRGTPGTYSRMTKTLKFTVRVPPGVYVNPTKQNP